MAAKKKASKAVAKRGSKSTAMTNAADWEKRMEEKANAESARVESGGGSYIGIRGKEFSFQGADLGEELEVVVLGFVYYNEYFDVPFDTDNPSSPACYALANTVGDLAPADNSPDRQADDCANCEMNAWGSAATGKGKACGNKRRVAVVSTEDLGNDPEDIEIALIKVPVTSGKDFDKFVKGVNKTLKRPIYGITTSITFDADEDFERLKFKPVDKIGDPELLEKIEAKLDEALDMLNAGHDPSNYRGGEDAKQQRPSSKKPAGKGGGLGKKKSGKRSRLS